MKTLKFKTNIKCGGCVATITPFLNNEKGVARWSVDTTSPQKILTVETAGLSAGEIVGILKKAGYQAELLAAD